MDQRPSHSVPVSIFPAAWTILALWLSLSLQCLTQASFVSTSQLVRRLDKHEPSSFSLCIRPLAMVNNDNNNNKFEHSQSKPTKSKPNKFSSRKQQTPTDRRQHSAARQTWRVFGVNVHPDSLESEVNTANKNMSVPIPIQKRYLSAPVLQALQSRLRIKQDLVEATADSTSPTSSQPLLDVRVVRRSLDARKTRRPGEPSGPRFTFVIDIVVNSKVAHNWKLRHQPGRLELLSDTPDTTGSDDVSPQYLNPLTKPRVVIVGAGPAGLFCALTLARSGMVTPVVLERGQPVESRGKHIGALMHRRSLHAESNFAFGEGGAGTWSDGKLTTRIGRNSDAVRNVLETFVQYGAPEAILLEGAPHLGTDNLVRLLRNMRHDLRELGGEIRFGAKMTGLVIENGVAKGVRVDFTEAVERGMGGKAVIPAYEPTETILGDAVVMATGHSARDVYEELHAAGIQLEAKGFAAGFRVEHPQKLINKIQYGHEWGPSVFTGKSVTDTANTDYFDFVGNKEIDRHPGRLPVPSYRLATDKAYDGKGFRGAYSFCMCPGGQIVPASTNPDEVCVNGMSFSKRDSQWANSALVVTISPDDEILEKYREEHGVLAGVAFQKDMERRASEFGGGNLTVPVQRLTDFVAGRTSTSAPPSSYRLGVKLAACHEIYPEPMVNALRDAVVNHFEKQLPGFLSEDGLLHAVETRTSSPVRISRDGESLQAIGTERLFPAGEGAGFAGGIVSAAVDGIAVAEAVLDQVDGSHRDSSHRKSSSKSVGFTY